MGLGATYNQDNIMAQMYRITRRGLLTLASGAVAPIWFPLYAGESGFWNKKDPSEWSSEEIDKMRTNSPWAKPVSITVRQQGSGGGGYGGGYPGGGMGGGGMGGGMGRGRRGGMGAPAGTQYKGEVRWLSAKPIQAAMKTPVPKELEGDYVLSVSGLPVVTGDRRSSGDSDSGSSNGPSQDVLDRIKGLTYLEPKGKPPIQPGTVQPGTAGFESNVLLFGFSREGFTLTLDDKEVSFTTQLGKLEVKTKFNLKEMMYHQELAV